MIHILKTNKDKSLDIVCENEVSVNDEFHIQVGDKLVKKSVSEIIEQRKERGVYIDENNRRFWAKVNYQ